MKNKEFVDVIIPFSPELVSQKDKNLLKLLVPAAKMLDEVFLNQVSQKNTAYRNEILQNADTETMEYFKFMAGPWDRLDADKPFWNNIPKPQGAGFYPEDITKNEFTAHIKNNPHDEKNFKSYFTVIRRNQDQLVAVPYAKEYLNHLIPAAALLQQASEILTDKPERAKLKQFLAERAKALLSNKYEQSDALWINCDDETLEVTYGPYEVYEDKLFGYKASFEAFIGIKDPELTRQLHYINTLIPEMEDELPVPQKFKSKHKKLTSNLDIIDLVIATGNAAAGVQTLAYVLPNDPEVTTVHGTKKIIMRNILRAKFEHILVPIAKHFMTTEQVEKIDFQAFFRHTLLHETGHSLGPKNTLNNNSIHESLADSYSIIEETKADTLALFLNRFILKRGFIEQQDLEASYTAMLAGFFRSLRFGLSSAHAKANAIQLNFMLEHGGVTVKNNKYSVNFEAIPKIIDQLIENVIAIEAEGNPETARKFIEKYTPLPKELTDSLEKISSTIPTDIKPRYEVEDWLNAPR